MPHGGTRTFVRSGESRIAGRLTVIEHKRLSLVHLKLVYDYTANNLIWRIREYTGGSNPSATATFVHDARGRLTDETRTGTSPYTREYHYDQSGNRVFMKAVDSMGQETQAKYFYALDNRGVPI